MYVRWRPVGGSVRKRGGTGRMTGADGRRFVESTLAPSGAQSFFTWGASTGPRRIVCAARARSLLLLSRNRASARAARARPKGYNNGRGGVSFRTCRTLEKNVRPLNYDGHLIWSRVYAYLCSISSSLELSPELSAYLYTSVILLFF